MIVLRSIVSGEFKFDAQLPFSASLHVFGSLLSPALSNQMYCTGIPACFHFINLAQVGSTITIFGKDIRIFQLCSIIHHEMPVGFSHIGIGP